MLVIEHTNHWVTAVFMHAARAQEEAYLRFAQSFRT